MLQLQILFMITITPISADISLDQGTNQLHTFSSIVIQKCIQLCPCILLYTCSNKLVCYIVLSDTKVTTLGREVRICEKQAPGLYVIRHFLFVQVPSGKMTICGQAPLVCARCLISLMVFCRELGSSRDTNTGCVKRVRAGDKRGANIRHGNRGTEITAILVYKTKAL